MSRTRVSAYKVKGASKDTKSTKVTTLQAKCNGQETNLFRVSSSAFVRDLEQLALKSRNVFIGEYQLLFVIGRGAHGKVLLVKSEQNGQKYALKLMSLETEKVSDVMREKTILQKVSTGICHFVVKAHDFWMTSGHIGFVTEYIPGITLKEQLSLVKCLSNEKTIFYTACTILALEYLHNINIFHRDISLRNMIVDEHGYIKIIDFGLALDNAETGPSLSMRLNKMVDFEDLGRCVWEMATGEEIHSVPSYSKKVKLSLSTLKFVQLIFPEGEVSKLAEINEAMDIIKSNEVFKKIDWLALKDRKLKPPFNIKILPSFTAAKPVWQDIANSAENKLNHKLKQNFRNVMPWKGSIE